MAAETRAKGPAKASLTIDDIPSPLFGEKLDFLIAKKLPALMFVTGCQIEGREENLVRAIRAGYPLGNHSWTHPAFSSLGREGWLDEIAKTDEAIDALYAEAGARRNERYFRFPYLDAGDTEEKRLALKALLEGRGYKAPPAPSAGYPSSSSSQTAAIGASVAAPAWGCDWDQREYMLGKDWGSGEIASAERLRARAREFAESRAANGDDGTAPVILIHDHDFSHSVFFDCVGIYLEAGISFASHWL